MRMSGELLAPGVQDTEEANFRPQASRVASNFEKGFGTATE
jgi:hypothetical protein